MTRELVMKYSDEELTAMAKSCQWYQYNRPELYSQFVIVMSMYTGLTPNEVHRRIVEMSESQ